jgi:penicillin G amidase
LLLLVLLVFSLSRSFFLVPPLGKMLDPNLGIFHNQEHLENGTTDIQLDRSQLADSVTVFFDARKVPHIFAKNAADLYFSQGYVTASFRLWQMDFLSYVSAGRLSEIFQDGYLDYDRNQRRLGIVTAAKASLDLMEKDTQTIAMLNAYTRGVNAYISKLRYETIPFEYKLLDYKPETWTNLKSLLILKQMANTLSGYEEDFNMTNLMLTLGEEKFNLLFPDYRANCTPVAAAYVSRDSPVAAIGKKPDYLNLSFMSTKPVNVPAEFNPRLGSNSWAVSGKKTVSGFPILCSDPHLVLSLPAVWFELQLSAPGINVYGVSLPGTPSVIIGFNNDIAWGLTNGQDDVKDWYKLKISDDYSQYKFDDQWLNLTLVKEEIKRKGQKPFIDSVWYTLHGPVTYNKSFRGNHQELSDCALKWSGHNPSNEFLTFLKLNEAKNYSDYKVAIRHYSSPVQNFTFACSNNEIAVNHQGKLPVKWFEQGKFILDGSLSSHVYSKYIPDDSLPHLLNPPDNFVISANQRPTNSKYPYYINGYFTETRANRIRELLKPDDKLDILKMKSIQLDTKNILSAEALPVLINFLKQQRLSASELKTVDSLKIWNGNYGAEDVSPAFFEECWKNIRKLTWDEFRQYTFDSKMPDDYTLLNLLEKDSANAYFDIQNTVKKENATDIVLLGFRAAIAYMNNNNYRQPVKWGDFHRANIVHLTRIPDFSRVNIPVSGCPDAINATASNWGPSWRMVVELGPRPKAFGIYPGGQSGNIGSDYADNFVTDWSLGKYYSLDLYETKEEAKKLSSTVWNLSSAK